MRKLLLPIAALLALSAANPTNAAIITDFGVNPTSAGGAFNHSLGTLTGAFEDQYTFQLDQSMTLTIASVTNVFPSDTDFITNFTGAVYNTGADGVVGSTDDFAVIGPALATIGCGPIDRCQGFAGSAFLDAGSYYAQFSGIAGGTSGYGGNIATVAQAVPGPIAGAGFPGILAGMVALWGLAKRRRQRNPAA